jgi:hypothetical protein
MKGKMLPENARKKAPMENQHFDVDPVLQPIAGQSHWFDVYRDRKFDGFPANGLFEKSTFGPKSEKIVQKWKNRPRKTSPNSVACTFEITT